MRIPDFTTSSFRGLNTAVKDAHTLKPGVATSSRNWITGKFGDSIALRRGMLLLGQTRNEGSGKITGIGVGRVGDINRLFFAYGQKLAYYNDADDDTAEIGADILGAGANGRDVWLAPYNGLGGAHMFAGSAYSSIFKIPVANPSSAVDQEAGTYRFGFLRFGQGRAFAGQRQGSDGKKDDTSFYLSYLDKATFGQFTQVTGEAVGSSGSTSYAGTLSAISGKKTAFLVVLTEASGEVVSDNGDGTLTGNQGSTGTINYATGAYSVTFNHTTTGDVTVDYFWEDSTDEGVLDFSFSSTRQAGEGNQFLQPDGGKFMASFPFQTVEYALHALKTWQYTASSDDTESTNLPYRNIGIPYHRAACTTPDGILMIDTSNPSEPKVRRLQIGANTDNLTVVPVSLSDVLDLSQHAFDKAVAFRWGDFEIVCCQDFVNAEKLPENTVMYVRNVGQGSVGAWDRLDYAVSCLDVLNGALMGGHSISNNVFTLFSGFDDDGSPIDNWWQDGYQDCGTENLKRAHRMVVKGLIQRDQRIRVLLSLDDGPYSEVFVIRGDGDYVDQGTNTSIGSYTIGSNIIGGGGDAMAHPFAVDFPIHTDRFQAISVRFEAEEIGYAEIDEYTYKDIRDKGRRSLSVKRV